MTPSAVSPRCRASGQPRRRRAAWDAASSFVRPRAGPKRAKKPRAIGRDGPQLHHPRSSCFSPRQEITPRGDSWPAGGTPAWIMHEGSTPRRRRAEGIATFVLKPLRAPAQVRRRGLADMRARSASSAAAPPNGAWIPRLASSVSRRRRARRAGISAQQSRQRTRPIRSIGSLRPDFPSSDLSGKALDHFAGSRPRPGRGLRGSSRLRSA